MMPSTIHPYPLSLTKNFLASVMRDSETDNNTKNKLQPIVEVFHINSISNKSNITNKFNYSMVISDGNRKAPVFIIEQLNHFIESGAIHKGSIVKLIDYESFVSNSLKTIKVIKMEVLVGMYDPTKINAIENISPSNNGVNNGVTTPIRTASPLPDSFSTDRPTMLPMIPGSNGDLFPTQPNGAQNILTAGAISMIAKGKIDKNLIVQVVYTFQSTEDIHLMFISDGLHMQIAMLAPPLNPLIVLKQLKKGTIVHLVDYICPTVHNGMKMIAINMEIKINDYEVIGEPKLYVEAIPRPNDVKEDLTNDTSFFMRQPRLPFPNRPIQDAYLPSRNNITTGGRNILPLGPPNRNVEVSSLMREVEHLQLEVNRLHSEMKTKQEKHEIEILRLKSDMLQQQKQSEYQINVMKKELEAEKTKKQQEVEDLSSKGVAELDLTEIKFGGFQINAMKKELEAVKTKKQQEVEDVGSKGVAELDLTEINFGGFQINAMKKEPEAEKTKKRQEVEDLGSKGVAELDLTEINFGGFQINAMKKELEAEKTKKQQEVEDLGSKGDAELDLTETNFEGLDKELEQIWL